MAKSDPQVALTDPHKEYSYASFARIIGRSPNWVKQSLVQTQIVPFVVVNGQVRLTGTSLQTYRELRDAGELEDFAVKK